MRFSGEPIFMEINETLLYKGIIEAIANTIDLFGAPFSRNVTIQRYYWVSRFLIRIAKSQNQRNVTIQRYYCEIWPVTCPRRPRSWAPDSTKRIYIRHIHFFLISTNPCSENTEQQTTKAFPQFWSFSWFAVKRERWIIPLYSNVSLDFYDFTFYGAEKSTRESQ